MGESKFCWWGQKKPVIKTWSLEEQREEIARLNTLIKVSGYDPQEMFVAFCHYPNDMRFVFRFYDGYTNMSPNSDDEVYYDFNLLRERVLGYLTERMTRDETVL